MSETDKIKTAAKEPDLAESIKTVAGMVKTIKTLGAGGTGALLVALFGAVTWLNTRLVTREDVERAVQDGVRKEVDPLKDRLSRLELALEYERREREKK